MTWFKLRWKSLTGAWRGRVALVAALMVPALAVLVLALGVAPALDRTDRIPVAVVNQDTGSEGPRSWTTSSIPPSSPGAR